MYNVIDNLNLFSLIVHSMIMDIKYYTSTNDFHNTKNEALEMR